MPRQDRPAGRSATPAALHGEHHTDSTHPALLEPGWWPAGREDKTTHLCGKWRISVENGTLYAHTP